MQEIKKLIELSKEALRLNKKAYDEFSVIRVHPWDKEIHIYDYEVIKKIAALSGEEIKTETLKDEYLEHSVVVDGISFYALTEKDEIKKTKSL